MKNDSPLFQPGKRTMLSTFAGLLALALCTPLAAQEPVKPQVQDTRPKYGLLFVVGYEMDKSRADAILQTQDLTKDVGTIVGKLEQLTKSRSASHSSCAAQVLRSGTRHSLDMGTSLLEIEPTMHASGKAVILTMQRTEKINNLKSLGSANLNFGEYAFIGTVPDVKTGKDMLLFMRCLVHHLN